MHIVIAGGSGFIGQALVNYFKQQKHKITVISRDPMKIMSKKIFDQSIQVTAWGSLNELRDVDVVINLAGENLFSGLLTQAKKDKLMQSRVNTTQQLVTWLQTQRNSITFLSASGINIYPSDTVIYTESDTIPSQGVGDFMSSLAKRWEHTANQAKSVTCRVINLRQAVVLDKSGGMLAKLLPISRYLSGVVFGDGQQPFLWIALADVVSAIDFLIKNTSIQGPVNLVAPDILTQEEFARELAAKFGKRCFIRIPEFVLKMTMRDLADELILTQMRAAPSVLMQNHFQFTYPNFVAFLKSLPGLG